MRVDMTRVEIAACEKSVLGSGKVQLDAYLLIIVVSGECSIVTPQKALVVTSKHAVLLSANTDYTWDVKYEARVMLISFTREVFFKSCLPVLDGCPLLSDFFVYEKARNNTENNTGNGMTYLVFENLTSEMMYISRQIIDEYKECGEYYHLVVLCGLMNLLLRLSRGCRVQASVNRQPNTQGFQKVLRHLIENYADTSLEDVARLFNYHPNTIAAMIKRNTGKTFGQIRRQIRINQAVKLMFQDGWSVQGAAEKCGFRNMSNFYAQFNKLYGMTPGEYIRSSKTSEKMP